MNDWGKIMIKKELNKYVKAGVILLVVTFVINNLMQEEAFSAEQRMGEQVMNVNVYSTVNQQLYGNLLANPTMAGNPNEGTISSWTPWYLIKIGGEYISTNYSFNNNQYLINGCKAFVSHTNLNEIVLNTGYDGNANDAAAYVSLTQAASRSNVIVNRTYKTSLFFKKATGNVALNIKSGDKIIGGGYEWIAPGTNLELTREIKSVENHVRTSFTTRGGIVTFDGSKTFLGLKYGSEWKQVDALFTSLDQNKLASGVTSETIQAAKATVDGIADNADATEMNAAITKAQELLAQKNEENAQTTIDGLFQGDQLAEGVTQETLDQAQAAIDQVTDSAKKQELQANLDQAQASLTKRNQEKAAQSAVDALFQGEQLAPNVTHGILNEVKILIDQVINSSKKQELQERFNNAQTMYHKYLLQVATESIRQLFTDNTFLEIVDSLNQEILNKTKQQIEVLPDSSAKKDLEKQLAKAQELFNKITSNQQAETLVTDLFANDSFERLSEDTTQSHIDLAKEQVNELEDPFFKEYLIELIEKAQQLWDIKSFKITKVHPYKVDTSEQVTGRYNGKNAAYMRLHINDQPSVLRPLIPQSLSYFSYPITNLYNTDKVSVTLYNSLAIPLSKKLVPIIPAGPTIITKLTPYLEGKSTLLMGTYTGAKATYIRVIIKNGTREQKLPMVSLKNMEKGQFQYYTKDLKATDEVFVSLLDTRYRELVRQPMIVYHD